MKTLAILQHVEAEYLGLMEDHFESRNIRFQYFRPFTAGGRLPFASAGFDGLIVLGAGPLGVVSGQLVPSLAPELRLAREFLDTGLPAIGIGLGAVILAVAAGGGAEEMPLRFEIMQAHATPIGIDELGLPGEFPAALYLRDRPVLPPHARVLAISAGGEPLVFALGERAFGFLGHPGAKSAMAEDVIMEFDETPDGTAQTLQELREAQGEIAANLSQLMVEIIARTGLMDGDTQG
jgi:GMP synthase (glutamine-hydrolysing)